MSLKRRDETVDDVQIATHCTSLLALVVAIILFPFAAHALDANREPFYILSEGATTCGEFTTEPETQTIRMEWILGYISGRNREAALPRDRLIGRSTATVSVDDIIRNIR